MSQQDLNYGAFNDDPTAESIRDGAIKIQSNFDELYAVVTPTDLIVTGVIEMAETSTPSAPAANKARIYFVDNGGSTEMRVIYANGTVHTIDTDVL